MGLLSTHPHLLASHRTYDYVQHQEEESTMAILSHMYEKYRTSTLVTWRKINKREECDECLARQYETRGITRRSPARTMRTTPTSTLHLCYEHAEAWKARDRGE